MNCKQAADFRGSRILSPILRAVSLLALSRSRVYAEGVF